MLTAWARGVGPWPVRAGSMGRELSDLRGLGVDRPGASSFDAGGAVGFSSPLGVELDEPIVGTESLHVVLGGDLVPGVSDSVALVGDPIPSVGVPIAIVGESLPLVGDPVAFVGGCLAPVGDPVAFVGDGIALVGQPFPLVQVGARAGFSLGSGGPLAFAGALSALKRRVGPARDRGPPIEVGLPALLGREVALHRRVPAHFDELASVRRRLRWLCRHAWASVVGLDPMDSP